MDRKHKKGDVENETRTNRVVVKRWKGKLSFYWIQRGVKFEIRATYWQLL
jgi:hypothetical protein